MMLDPAIELELAINDMLGIAAMVDVMQSHLERNAASARETFPTYADYRVMMLTASEARALDHVLNEVICAAEKLRQAHEAVA